MDSFIPIIIGLIIVLFIYAFIREARKQKKAASSLFQDIAGKHGWSFREEDNGIIQDLAKGFDGFGVFHSPSIGKIIPKNVISGSVPAGAFYFFQQYRRIYEGYALNFNVCFLKLGQSLCKPLVIRFKKGKKKIRNELYEHPEIPVPEKWKNDIEIFSIDENEVADLLDDVTLETLIEESKKLLWRVDAQIRQDRLAVYISERNPDIESENDFQKLLEFTQNLAESLIKSKKKQAAP